MQGNGFLGTLCGVGKCHSAVSCACQHTGFNALSLDFGFFCLKPWSWNCSDLRSKGVAGNSAGDFSADNFCPGHTLSESREKHSVELSQGEDREYSPWIWLGRTSQERQSSSDLCAAHVPQSVRGGIMEVQQRLSRNYGISMEYHPCAPGMGIQSCPGTLGVDWEVLRINCES